MTRCNQHDAHATPWVVPNEVAKQCYTEKAPNAWHRHGTQKTGNTYLRSTQTTVNQHGSQTIHQALSKAKPMPKSQVPRTSDTCHALLGLTLNHCGGMFRSAARPPPTCNINGHRGAAVLSP